MNSFKEVVCYEVFTMEVISVQFSKFKSFQKIPVYFPSYERTYAFCESIKQISKPYLKDAMRIAAKIQMDIAQSGNANLYRTGGPAVYSIPGESLPWNLPFSCPKAYAMHGCRVPAGKIPEFAVDSILVRKHEVKSKTEEEPGLWSSQISDALLDHWSIHPVA